MNQSEYRKTFFCDCPKCGGSPEFVDDGYRQWATCKPCGGRWIVGDKLLDDCQPANETELKKLSQWLVH